MPSLGKVCLSFRSRDTPAPSRSFFTILIVRQCDYQANTLGMDSHSVSYMLPGEKGEWRVDVPMRSFQGGEYSSSSSKSCCLIIAQRLLPSAYRTLQSPWRTIPAFEFFIFVFSPRCLTFPLCGSLAERNNRTFCHLPSANLQRRFWPKGDKCSIYAETNLYHTPTRYSPTRTSTARRRLLLRLIYGQPCVYFLPVATSCLPVAAREELQGAILGTMGGFYDTAWTNIEDGWIRQALAHVYARCLLSAVLCGLHSAAE